MANIEIRDAIKKARLFHYEIADELGMSESAFSKLMRTELTPEKKEKILQAINKIQEV
nr:MAG TPA: Regulatory protein [Caudoviricetes sp.]